MSEESDDLENVNGMDDRRVMDAMFASHVMAGATKRLNPIEAALAVKMRDTLARAIKNLERTDELAGKVCNLSEDLAIERMSNKRMRDLLADLRGVLHGAPACYPAPLAELVARIQKEVGI